MCNCAVVPNGTTDAGDGAALICGAMLDVMTIGAIWSSSHRGVSVERFNNLIMRERSVMGRIVRKPSPLDPMINGMVSPYLV